ncbi:uncharacterized protein LOC120626602 isoform X2 [Pararge aegeria]|nr:uncharacterized protein LOC120626602 isoform X2 [Pararge aegeria]
METNFNGSVNPIVCVDCDKDNNSNEPFISFVWYITLSCVCFVVVIILMAVGRLLQIGQKTRTTQQRRTFIAPRQRPSVSHAEPTIYVSPANLPPPPKYEAMAPPSYEEVVGIHYPNYQPPVQPITQPITTALAQSSNSADNVTHIESQTNASIVPSNVIPSTVMTITNERTVVTSSS